MAGGNDFFLDFGSNAESFSKDLVDQTAKARQALQALIADATKANAQMTRLAGVGGPKPAARPSPQQATAQTADQVLNTIETRLVRMGDSFAASMNKAGDNLRDALRDAVNLANQGARDISGSGGKGKGKGTNATAVSDDEVSRDKAGRSGFDRSSRSLTGAMDTLAVKMDAAKNSTVETRKELQLFNNQMDYLAAKFQNLTLIVSEINPNVQVSGNAVHHPGTGHATGQTPGVSSAAGAGGHNEQGNPTGGAPLSATQRATQRAQTELVTALNAETRAVTQNAALEVQKTAITERLNKSYQAEMNALDVREKQVRGRKIDRGGNSPRALDQNTNLSQIENERAAITGGYNQARAQLESDPQGVQGYGSMINKVFDAKEAEFVQKYGVNEAVKQQESNRKAGGTRSGQIPFSLNRAVGGMTPEQITALPAANQNVDEYRKAAGEFARTWLQQVLAEAPEIARAMLPDSEALRSNLSHMDRATVGEFNRKQRDGEEATPSFQRQYFGARSRLQELSATKENMESRQMGTASAFEFLTGQDRARGGLTAGKGSKVGANRGLLSGEAVDFLQSRGPAPKDASKSDIGQLRQEFNRFAGGFQKNLTSNNLPELEAQITRLLQAEAKVFGRADPGQFRFAESGPASSAPNAVAAVAAPVEAEAAEIAAPSTAAATAEKKKRTSNKPKKEYREDTPEELAEKKSLSADYKKLGKKDDDTAEQATRRAEINARRSEIRASQLLTVAETQQATSATAAAEANQNQVEATTSAAQATRAKEKTATAASTAEAKSPDRAANTARGADKTEFDAARANLKGLQRQAKKSPQDQELQAAIAAAEGEVERLSQGVETPRSRKPVKATPTDITLPLRGPNRGLTSDLSGPRPGLPYVPPEYRNYTTPVAGGGGEYVATRNTRPRIPTEQLVLDHLRSERTFGPDAARNSAPNLAGRPISDTQRQLEQNLAHLFPDARPPEPPPLHVDPNARIPAPPTVATAARPGAGVSDINLEIARSQAIDENNERNSAKEAQDKRTQRRLLEARRKANSRGRPVSELPNTPDPDEGFARPPVGNGAARPPGIAGAEAAGKADGLYSRQLSLFTQETQQVLAAARSALEGLTGSGNAGARKQVLDQAAEQYRFDPQYAQLPSQKARKQAFGEALGLESNNVNNRLVTDYFKQGGLLESDPRNNAKFAALRGRTSSGGAEVEGKTAVEALQRELTEMLNRVRAINPGASAAEINAVVTAFARLTAATQRYATVANSSSTTVQQLASATAGASSATAGLHRAVNVATGGAGIPAGGAGGGLGGPGGGGGFGGGGPIGGAGTPGGNAGGGIQSALFGRQGFGPGLLAHAGRAIENTIAYSVTFQGIEKLHELVVTGIEAQTAFVRLQASLDALHVPIGNLKTDLIGISSATAQPIQQVTEAAAELAGTLKNTADIKVGTTVAAQLANISQGTLTATEAAVGLRDVTAAYGNTWKAQGLTAAQGIKQVGDQIASLSQITGVSVKDITEGTTQLAQEAKHFGLKENQAAVLSAEVTRNTGETGEASAEQVSRILSTLNSGKVQQVLVQTGVASKGQFQQVGGLATVMGQLIEKFDKLTPSAQQAIFSLVGSGRQARAFTGLMNDSTQITKLFNDSQSTTGSLAKQNQMYLNSLGGALKQLSEDFQNVGATLAQMGAFDAFGLIVKGIDEALKLVNQFLTLVNTLANSNPLTKFAKEGVLAVGTLLIAMTALGALYRATIGRLATGGGGLFGRGGSNAGGAGASGSGTGAGPNGGPNLRQRIFGGNVYGPPPGTVGPTPQEQQGAFSRERYANQAGGYGGIFRPRMREGAVFSEDARGRYSTVRPANAPFGPLSPADAAAEEATRRRAPRISFNPFSPQFATSATGGGFQVAGRGINAIGGGVSNIAGRLAGVAPGVSTRLDSLATRITNVGAASERAGTAVQNFGATAGRFQNSMTLVSGALTAFMIVLPFIIQTLQDGAAKTKQSKEALDAALGRTSEGKNSAAIGSDSVSKAQDATFKGPSIAGAVTSAAGKLLESTPIGAIFGLGHDLGGNDSGGVTSTKYDQSSGKAFQNALKKLRGAQSPEELAKSQKEVMDYYDKNADTLVKSAGDQAAQRSARADLTQTLQTLQQIGAKRQQQMDGIKAIDELNETQIAAIGTYVQNVGQFNKQTLGQTQTLTGVLAAQTLLDPGSQAAKDEAAANDPNSSDAKRRAANISLLQAGQKSGASYLKSPNIQSILKSNPNDPTTAAFIQNLTSQAQQLQTLQTQQFTIPAGVAQSASQLAEGQGHFAEAQSQLETANKVWEAYAATLAHDDPAYVATLQNITNNKIKAAQLQVLPQVQALQVQAAGTADPVLAAGFNKQIADLNLTAAQKGQAQADTDQSAGDKNRVKNAQDKLDRAVTAQHDLLANRANHNDPEAIKLLASGKTGADTTDVVAARAALKAAQVSQADNIRKNKNDSPAVAAAKVASEQAAISQAQAQESETEATSTSQIATVRNATLNAQSRGVELQRQAVTYSKGTLADSTKLAGVHAQMIALNQEEADIAQAFLQAQGEYTATNLEQHGDLVGAANKRAQDSVQAWQYLRSIYGDNDARTVAAAAATITTAKAAFVASLTQATAQADEQATKLETTGAALGGNVVKAAMDRAVAAQKVYLAYLFTEGAAGADTIAAHDAAMTAARSAFDTALNQQLATLDFQQQTYAITSTQEIASLQQILKNKNLTLAEQQSIVLKIKGLQESIRQALTQGGLNIPSDIKLPTAYQVRRSLSGVAGTGNTQAIVTNNTQATNNVTISNQGISQSDMQKITQAVVNAVSTTTGTAVRANTATPSLVNRGG